MLKGNAWPIWYMLLFFEPTIEMTVDTIQEELNKAQTGQLWVDCLVTSISSC